MKIKITFLSLATVFILSLPAYSVEKKDQCSNISKWNVAKKLVDHDANVYGLIRTKKHNSYLYYENINMKSKV